MTENDIRSLARDELRTDMQTMREELHTLRDDVQTLNKSYAEAASKAAKALERLSLIVVGDEELRVRGLLSDVDDLKQSRQQSLMERAKLGGIWIGVSAVGLAILRIFWYFLGRWLEKAP